MALRTPLSADGCPSHSTTCCPVRLSAVHRPSETLVRPAHKSHCAVPPCASTYSQPRSPAGCTATAAAATADVDERPWTACLAWHTKDKLATACAGSPHMRRTSKQESRDPMSQMLPHTEIHADCSHGTWREGREATQTLLMPHLDFSHGRQGISRQLV